MGPPKEQLLPESLRHQDRTGEATLESGRSRGCGPDPPKVQAGLARSYQITSIFRRFSVLDNLALAVQARSGSSLSFWRPVAAEKALYDEAASISKEIGLQDRLSSLAMTLAHGEQRALEVGLALATRPKLVLLDEPMAGMGPEESQRMIELIQRIRAQVSLSPLLVVR